MALLFTMKIKNRYINNLSWSLSEQLLRIFTGFFVGVWLIRYLGPEDFGVYAYITSFVMIFSTLAKLGLNNIILKEVVNKTATIEELINNALTLKLIGSSAIFLTLILTSQLFEHSSEVNLYLAIIGIGIIFQSLDVVEYYHQAIVNIKPVTIAKTMQLIASSLLKIIFILQGAELETFVWLALLDIILISIFYIFIFTKNDGLKLKLGLDSKLIKHYWHLGWPIAISNLAMIAYVKMDQIMIFNLMNEQAVGIYAAATKISEAWYFVPTIITATLFPAILKLKQQNQLNYEKSISLLFSLVIILGLSVAIPVSLAADWIINLLYGEVYTESAKVLIVHIWVGVFIGLGIAASKWFVAEELQKLFLVRTMTGLVVNFILNLILIPKYGVLGAAIATLISVIFANVLSYLFNKKLWPLFLLTLGGFNLFKAWKTYNGVTLK